jgi:hypothetical protein
MLNYLTHMESTQMRTSTLQVLRLLCTVWQRETFRTIDGS